MSINGRFLRVGTHVLNLSRINYIWFDNSPWADGGDPVERAFVDFGNIDSDGWDLILAGDDALALEAYFGQEEEGDTLGGDAVQ